MSDGTFRMYYAATQSGGFQYRSRMDLPEPVPPSSPNYVTRGAICQDFSTTQPIVNGGANPLGKADFNGDCQDDRVWLGDATGSLSVWYMDGIVRKPNGAVAIVPSPLTPTSWKLRGAADFDADGKPDLLWQDESTGSLGVWYMDGVVRKPNGAVAIAPSPVTPTSWKIVAPK
jgi:hypothetical protein